jgi:hypothetical protein
MERVGLSPCWIACPASRPAAISASFSPRIRRHSTLSPAFEPAPPACDLHLPGFVWPAAQMGQSMLGWSGRSRDGRGTLRLCARNANKWHELRARGATVVPVADLALLLHPLKRTAIYRRTDVDTDACRWHRDLSLTRRFICFLRRRHPPIIAIHAPQDERGSWPHLADPTHFLPGSHRLAPFGPPLPLDVTHRSGSPAKPPRAGPRNMVEHVALPSLRNPGDVLFQFAQRRRCERRFRPSREGDLDPDVRRMAIGSFLKAKAIWIWT